MVAKKIFLHFFIKNYFAAGLLYFYPGKIEQKGKGVLLEGNPQALSAMNYKFKLSTSRLFNGVRI